MKTILFNTWTTLITLIFVNLKQVIAADKFFDERKISNPRSDLFKLTDFKVPTFHVHLNDIDYQKFFFSFECERYASPNFVERKDECYTAPWVNLTYSLDRALSKNYIPKSKIKDQADLSLIDSVLKTHTHNLTVSEFDALITKYTDYTIEELFTTPYKLTIIPSTEFETKDASLTFELDGEKTEIEKIKFSVGGRSTKAYSKLGYNINIKKGKLFGTKQIRLRPEVVDPTLIREKLAYDLHRIVDLPTLSANYALLYVNDTFMGFYLMRDAYKSQWIEDIFNEKDTKHLYTCDKSYGSSVYFNCKNDDDEITDDHEFENFLAKLGSAKNRKDVEKFFDVNTYFKWQVSRYVFGSWDHKTHSHNNVLYLYRDEQTGKELWIPFLYDFDMNFGAYRCTNVTETFQKEIIDETNPIYELLDFNDKNEQVLKIMEEMVRKALNPVVSFPRIDELKEFIDQYVKEDRTPGADGRLPGRMVRMNNKVEDHYEYEDFVGNTDFTTVKSKQYSGDTLLSNATCLGIKHWIIGRFKHICKTYNFDCSYADEILSLPEYTNYEIPVNRREAHDTGCNGTSYSCCIFNDTPVLVTDSTGRWGIEGDKWCLMNEEVKKEEEEEECWSEKQGYPCCTKETTKIKYTDKKTNEQWGIENNNWCGITDLQRCPGYSQGYPCCEGCTVKFTDSIQWGIEHGEWCSIPVTCGTLQKIK